MFQGKFKSENVSREEYLVYLYAYVLYNGYVHESKKKYKSCLEDAFGERHSICTKEIKNCFGSINEFDVFAKPIIEEIVLQRKKRKARPTPGLAWVE